MDALNYNGSCTFFVLLGNSLCCAHTHFTFFMPGILFAEIGLQLSFKWEAITAIKLIKTLSSIHQLGRKFCVANFPIGNRTSRQTERIVVKPMKPTQLQDASMLPVIKGRAQIFTKHDDARERSF